MSKKRRSVTPIVLGAVVGLFFGIVLYLTYDRPDSYQPITVWSHQFAPPHPKSHEKVLHVNILGIWNYDKTSTDLNAFRTEIFVLSIGPLVIGAIVCSMLGAVAFHFFDQCICGKLRTKADQ